MKVVRAHNLLNMDFLSTSDPYVKLSLTGERLPAKKTTVKMNNLNPEWCEDFKLTVKDPEAQALQLQLYDWERVTHPQNKFASSEAAWKIMTLVDVALN